MEEEDEEPALQYAADANNDQVEEKHVEPTQQYAAVDIHRQDEEDEQDEEDFDDNKRLIP